MVLLNEYLEMSTCPVLIVVLLQLVLLVQLVLFTSRTTLLPLLLVLLQLHVSVLEISPSMTIDHRRCVVGSSISVAEYIHFQLRMVVYAPMSALMYTSNYGLYISMSYISIYTAAYTSNFNGWYTTMMFNSPHVHLWV